MNLPLWDVCKNFHRGNPQSVKANEIAHKYKVPTRQLIMEALERHQDGLTCEELEDLLFTKHQTVSARCSDLKHEGKIKVMGERMTRSGSPAAIYQTT